MKTYICVLLLVVCVVGLPATKDRKYSGAQVIKVIPETQSHVSYLRGLLRSGKYDFLTTPGKPGMPVDIMALRWDVPVLKKTLTHTGMTYQVAVGDVYRQIIQFRMENEKALQKARKEGKEMEWTAYHEYDEIMDWADSLASTYPSLVTVEDVGTSYEGRTMKLVKVSTGGSGKPAIFTDAGIHAREWISPATITYIMNEILTRNSEFSDILDTIDLYFMPDINPDGYSYSWSSDRMWRKTRSHNSGKSCVGVDANRNWDFHWMENGASDAPCSEIYAGPEPFSEPETQHVRDQMLKYSDAAQVYITFHSYGQYWVYPWGYDSSVPDDVQDLADLANAAVDALEAVHGTDYSVGPSGVELYPAAGASDDYAKGVAGIKYAYTVELRDTGNYGFTLPPDQIIPTGEETFAAFEVVMNFVKDTYGRK